MNKHLRNLFRITQRLLVTFSQTPVAFAFQFKNIPHHLSAFRFAKTASLAPAETTNSTAPAVSENPLWRYFDAHQEGPGIWKWDHYFEVYHRHLAKFVGRSTHLVEVGIYSGGSLQMWRSYFGPGMHVHGIDIEPACEVYRTEGVDIHIGDQADRTFWSAFRQKVPQVDILIDDGGHSPEQQQVTLEEIFPHLRPGGVYICEDIHGDHNRFASYLSGYCNAMNQTVEQGPASLAVNPLQKWMHSIHFYPCMVVIEKRDAELASLHNSRRGTQWQPFFPDRVD